MFRAVSIIPAITLLVALTPTPRPPFREAEADTGLRFVHDNGGRGQFYLPEIMGSGAALFDFDGDGDLDVYLVQGRPLDSVSSGAGGASGKEPRGNRLFRNDLTIDANGTRTMRFVDVTEQAHVGLDAVGMGVAVGDIDNDGRLDLYVTNFGSNVLFHNNGDGTFTDIPRAAGLLDERSTPTWGTSAAFVDYDRDGYVDLFVANYVDFTVANNKVCYDPVGTRDYCTPKAYKPVPARLFHNDRHGHFIDVSEASGITRAYGNGLGVSIGDYDGDGWLDIYVANDAMSNQLWINKHDGTFEDRGLLSGTAVNALGNPEGSMGIASGDFDNDGDEDLFVTNLVGESHALYVNDGRGNFEDLRGRAGLTPLTAPFTGFGTKWFDYDHDGLLDLFVANGAVNIIEKLRGEAFPFHQRNQLLHQERDGRFRDVGADAAAGPGGNAGANADANAGEALRRSEVSRGAAFGDIDNDGDVDILVTNNNGPVRLLLNDTNAMHASASSNASGTGNASANASGSGNTHWLELRLEQPTTNRWAFGARVTVDRRGQPTLTRRGGTAGSYLSASDARVHFGLGAASTVDAVTVEWPDASGPAQRERWTNVAADRIVTLKRGTGTAVQP
jgi:enediyne biosynthesis protein E4